MPTNAIRALFEDAGKQVSLVPHIPIGFIEPTAYVKKKPAVVGTLNLNAVELPKLLDRDGQLAVIPSAFPAGERFTLAAAVLQMSRVAAAGAQILTRPDPDRAIAIGKGTRPAIALEHVARYFSTINAAPFSTVADDADVGVSALPVQRAEIDWSESIAKAVRFEVKRSDRKLIGEDIFSDEVLLSLVLGLARTADTTLLAAITAATPSAFTLGAAAAQGLRVDELRALIGTSGTGAAWRGDGVLTAANIEAELTADTVATFIGAFNRSAVAIHEDVTVTVERRNTQGDLVVTAYANVIPLLPTAATFWTLS